MSVFEFESYKKFLREHISDNRRPGLIAELAKAAGCDRTYFSQMLNGKAQLTADHAVNLAGALGMTENEQSFFLLLVLFERAGSAPARAHFRRRMDAIQKDSLILARKIKAKETTLELDEEQRAWYYSSWLPGAVHILTSVEELQAPAAMAAHLHMDIRALEQVLGRLREMGLVRKSEGKYVHSGQNIHIPNDSPYYVINHGHWRMRGMEKAASGQGVHYSTTFSISAKDVPRLRTELLKFIERQRALVHASGAEVVHCFSCDLFDPA